MSELATGWAEETEARIDRAMGPRKPVKPRQRGDSSGSKGMPSFESWAASKGRLVQSQWTGEGEAC